MTRAGLNLIQQALTIYDDELRLVICNRRFGEMFRLPSHLLTRGANFKDTIRHLVENGEYGDVGDITKFVQDRVDTARAFEPHYMERVRANGQIISVEGAPLSQGGWVAVYTDITRIKRQEDMLRGHSEELSGQLLNYAEELAAKNRQLEATNTALEQAKRELTEIEARTRLTTEMMPAHIAHVNLERRYTYSNRKLSSVMPERPSDIIGRTVAETLGAQAYVQLEEKLNRAFQGEANVFEFYDDLSSRRIRTALTPDEKDKKIVGVYILSMDVTEETQARSALQQASKRQMAAQLTNGLAHDFSNLLTIIMGAQSRLDKLLLGPDAHYLIDATKDAAARGGVLLNSIADMTGTRKLSPEDTHIPTLFERLTSLAWSALPKEIELVIKNSLPSENYLLDNGMLQDSLLNLILNARDALEGNGKIILSAQEIKNTWIEFTITDTGPGFSQDALKNAMNPFYTTKGTEGTGLGLTMVYDMAKLSGGEVALNNNYAGARVVLRLPQRKAIELIKPGLVLLVEDNPALRDNVRLMLTGLGHSVVEASSVVEAQSLIEGLPEISLILCDLRLEGQETGVDLAANLSSLAPPIIFMTSLPAIDDLHQDALRLGTVLPKPFDTGTLKLVLQNGHAL
ncbi:MAG: PAS domain-containing protein [Marinovum sp.]|nr:PAS domain-containing protein [Marinovum sp.]MBT6532625.1 PAS domain-containing protein [Marinovum sp.]